MVTAIIAAAGRGRRMGCGENKVFLPLAGRPVLAYSVAAFDAAAEVDALVVAAAAAEVDRVEEMLEGLALVKPWRVVAGGEERRDSVANALAALAPADEIVLVHDGARPLVDGGLIAAAVAAARRDGAAAAAVPVKDTIKAADAARLVTATPDRAGLWAVQTPQAFCRDVLERAYARSREDGFAGTDDASLVERTGAAVRLFMGSYRNLKITTAEDLLMAEALLAKRPARAVRVGMGYDVHRLTTGRDLILGGVKIPHDKGLLGHSDADALLHAVKDALLGAAGLGDIGRHFPDGDERYRGASSLALLAEVNRKLAARGVEVLNVDATIVAQAPKLAPYIETMNEKIAATLGIPRARVNVKATTTEGLGFAGRKEGVAAYAVASVLA